MFTCMSMCACLCGRGGQRQSKGEKHFVCRLYVLYMEECSNEASESDAQTWVQEERKGLNPMSYKHVSKVPWRERGTARTNG